jgi:hypothetical protein
VLLSAIERITEKQLTKGFQRTIWQLVTLLRQNADSQLHAPSFDNSLKELEYIEKAMNENMRLFDIEKGINAKTQRAFTDEFITRDLVDERDPVLNLYGLSRLFLEITSSVKKRTLAAKENNKRNAFNSVYKMRQIAAEELARALDEELDFKPGKTREGKFEQCLREMFKAAECELDGRQIYLEIPIEMFEIIKNAIDDYPKKPRFSLLLREGEILPGLSGDLPT